MFILKIQINNIPALNHRPGNKPLSEPKMASFLTHICATRPQWVKKMAILAKPYDTEAM